MNELVSVMMPTYNTVQYIDAALLSLMAQTDVEMEVLAYDDHSTDGTYERLQFWSKVDNRIRVARPFSEHGHYTDICNQLIEDSRGGFVARMDSDDISLPERLAVQKRFMHDRSNLTLLGAMALTIVTEEGNRICDTFPWESTIIKPVASREVPVNEAIRTHHRLVHGTLFSRRTDLLSIGGYEDLFPIEDWELSLKMADAGGEVFVLPDILYMRRIHPVNSSKEHPGKLPAFEYINKLYNLGLESLPRSRPANL